MYKAIPGVKVMAFGHKARHGKDTSVDAIVARYGNRVKRFAFADSLKMFCRINHGMTTKDPALLQRVGHDMRQHDPLFWVKLAYWSIDEARPEVALISDMRYVNEAEFIKAMGGVTVNVTRFTPDGAIFIDPSRDPNHPSECDLDGYKYDHYLRNNRGAGDLACDATELFYNLYGS